VNLERLDAGLASIDAGEKPWAQASWRCGTGGCLAAHIGFAAGWFWTVREDSTSSLMSKPGELDSIARRVARQELGLTSAQAEVLFHEGNSRRALQAMRDHLAEHPDATDDELRTVQIRVHQEEAEEAYRARELAATDPQRAPRGWQQVDG
jgi:hypothetical protein